MSMIGGRELMITAEYDRWRDEVQGMSVMIGEIADGLSALGVDAPEAFDEVRTELRLLNSSLSSFVSIIPLPHITAGPGEEQKLRGCIDEILECCGLALESLGSYLDRYQRSVIKMAEEKRISTTNKRFSVPLALKWGNSVEGNIYAMQDVLHIFVTTIDLTINAVKSGSIAMLEQVIAPMASEVHDLFGGDSHLKRFGRLGSMSSSVNERRFSIEEGGKLPAEGAWAAIGLNNMADPVSPEIVYQQPVMMPSSSKTPDEDARSRLSSNASTFASTSTIGESLEFKRALFRNAAILSDGRGCLVSFARPTHQGDHEMVRVATDCQILLLKRQSPSSSGRVKDATISIWVLSDDGQIKMQQELNDVENVVPYTIWGSMNQILLRVRTNLSFHPDSIQGDVLATVPTTWVSYEFKTEQGSQEFQSALLDRKLLLSVKTNRTMSVHENVFNPFSSPEQICGLENLRLWQDLNGEGVLLMIHYSPRFRDGYLAFYVNSTQNRVRVIDGPDRTVKIKAFRILGEEDPSSTTSLTSSHSSTSLSSAASTSPSGNKDAAKWRQSIAGTSVGHGERKQRYSSGKAVSSGAKDETPSVPGAATSGPGESGGAVGKHERPLTAAKIEFSSDEDKAKFLDMIRWSQGFYFTP